MGDAYAKVLVTIDEHLPSTLSAHVLGNLLELASWAGLLDRNGRLRDLVGEKARGIPPPPEDELGICLLCIDDSLLDVLVDGGLDGSHEAGAHVDTAGTKGERGSETIAVSEAARGNEGDLEGLSGPAQENEVGDVVLTDVAGALEAVDGEEVDAQLDGRLCVPDCCALVEDGGAANPLR